ncbi:mitotic-spindle organizing protein 1, putative [Babesia caballi]|uniref:Mitotic-spindle organizing protein 1, putative n=1 Tax=Babesia caballi TaxID=5871 RepID=A0AAV4LQV0_BABCB|nr:mitotic-spindle organizing protein 1, putative [Babesia caballi]
MASGLSNRQESFITAESDGGLAEEGIKEEGMDIIFEISKILNTGLDRQTLAILVGLCEKGVDPTVLAYVVKHLKEARTSFLSKFTAPKRGK